MVNQPDFCIRSGWGPWVADGALASDENNLGV
jgi:hypothetical protein